MIGILALCTRESGGVCQYTQVLIETLVRFTKYEYLIIKNKAFVVPALPENRCRCIEVDGGPSAILTKTKRVVYLEMPALRKYLDVSAGYKAIDCYDDIELLINPVPSLAPLYIRKPFITTIHDMQHKHHPEFFTFRERLARNLIFKHLSRGAISVVCESEHVKKDLAYFLNIPQSKIRVLQSPPMSNILRCRIDIRKKEEIKRKYRLGDCFFFYPAQFWPHKNHTNLIRALDKIKTRFGQTANLVLAGSRSANERNFEDVMAEIRKLKLEECVKYLGYISDDEIPYLYALSTALVMPTLFESVSIPIWEAFFLGVPVVSSNVCALPQQVGEAGLLFDPDNVDDIADKMYRIWTDGALRTKLINKGFEKAKNNTLENHAGLWERAIDEALALVRR